MRHICILTRKQSISRQSAMRTMRNLNAKCQTKTIQIQINETKVIIILLAFISFCFLCQLKIPLSSGYFYKIFFPKKCLQPQPVWLSCQNVGLCTEGSQVRSTAPAGARVGGNHSAFLSLSPLSLFYSLQKSIEKIPSSEDKKKCLQKCFLNEWLYLKSYLTS